MKITIISLGKFENSPHKAVFENYLQRFKWKVELKELQAKNAKNLETYGLSPQKGVAGFPRIMGCSIRRFIQVQ